jgi:hypothetical protein
MASRGKKGRKARLGELAVQKGYCTPEEVAKALKIQREQQAAGRAQTLSGIIMVQNGTLSTGQLIDLLREYEGEDAGEEGASGA